MSVTISFLGGTGTVTGSKYLVRFGRQALMVDCGLFQGYKQLRLRNWNPLPVAPDQIDGIVLTHAHLDHSGYLPLLIKEGYSQRVFASPATRDLCAVLLPDSGHLQEEDAAFLNRHKLSKHATALPLYTRRDALDALSSFETHDFGKPFSPIKGWRLTLSGAGHILGASSVLIEVGGRRLLFSGDLGRPDDLLMSPPEPPPQADTVLIESTYGDRIHPRENLLEELTQALQRVAKRGGVAVVPVFAVGRAQALLHAIHLLKVKGELPASLPVFLDSPMAVETTHLYEQHIGGHRLSRQDTRALTHSATMVSSTDDSMALASRHGPMVILSASGMATGGRVLHHLSHYAGDHRNMIVLTGYQAPGTRGASLARGASSLRIHGREVSIAAEVVQLQSASAHADADQLIGWLRQMPEAPGQVFVVHGDVGPADALRWRIKNTLGLPALVPEHGSTWPA